MSDDVLCPDCGAYDGCSFTCPRVIRVSNAVFEALPKITQQAVLYDLFKIQWGEAKAKRIIDEVGRDSL